MGIHFSKLYYNYQAELSDWWNCILNEHSLQLIQLLNNSLPYKTFLIKKQNSLFVVKLHKKIPQLECLYSYLFEEIKLNSVKLKEELNIHFICYDTMIDTADYVLLMRPFLSLSPEGYLESVVENDSFDEEVKLAEKKWILYQLERIEQILSKSTQKHGNICLNNIYIDNNTILCLVDAIPQAKLYCSDDLMNLQNIQSKIEKITGLDVNLPMEYYSFSWNPQSLYNTFIALISSIQTPLNGSEIIQQLYNQLNSDFPYSDIDFYFLLKLVSTCFILTKEFTIMQLLNQIVNYQTKFTPSPDSFTIALLTTPHLVEKIDNFEKYLVGEQMKKLNLVCLEEDNNTFQIELNTRLSIIDCNSQTNWANPWIMHRFYGIDGSPDFVFWLESFFLILICGKEIVIFWLNNLNLLLLCRPALKITCNESIKQAYMQDENSFIVSNEKMAIIYTIEFEELKIIGYKEKWMRLQDKQSIIVNNCEYFIQNGWYYKRKRGKNSPIYPITTDNCQLKVFDGGIFICSPGRLTVHVPSVDLVVLDCSIKFDWDEIGSVKNEFVLFQKDLMQSLAHRYSCGTFSDMHLPSSGTICMIQDEVVVTSHGLYSPKSFMSFKVPLVFAVSCPKDPATLCLVDARGACFLVQLNTPDGENS